MKQDTPRPQVRDTRNGDWFWVNKLVLDHPYLTSSAKVVYGALAYFADNKTQKSFPSFETLSQLTHLKRITVIKAIRQLEDYYFIKTQKSPGKSNSYVLLKLTDSHPVKKIYQSIKGTGVVLNRHQQGYKIDTTNNTHLTKLNNKNVKKLNFLKKDLMKKTEMTSPSERAKVQEEVGAEIRPSGKV